MTRRLRRRIRSRQALTMSRWSQASNRSGSRSSGQVPPGSDERLLDRVARELRVAEDQAGGRVQPREVHVEERGEGVMFASPRSLDRGLAGPRSPRVRHGHGGRARQGMASVSSERFSGPWRVTLDQSQRNSRAARTIRRHGPAGRMSERLDDARSAAQRGAVCVGEGSRPGAAGRSSRPAPAGRRSGRSTPPNPRASRNSTLATTSAASGRSEPAIASPGRRTRPIPTSVVTTSAGTDASGPGRHPSNAATATSPATWTRRWRERPSASPQPAPTRRAAIRRAA